MARKNNTEVDLAVMAKDISSIRDDVTEIKLQLESKYVTQVEFDPVKKVVYGLVGLILVAVAGAIIALVVVK